MDKHCSSPRERGGPGANIMRSDGWVWKAGRQSGVDDGVGGRSVGLVQKKKAE